jgi:hypothetical protein
LGVNQLDDGGKLVWAEMEADLERTS